MHGLANAIKIWNRVLPALSPSQRAMDLLPEAPLALIDACGHYPHGESPEAFVSAVAEFLA